MAGVSDLSKPETEPSTVETLCARNPAHFQKPTSFPGTKFPMFPLKLNPCAHSNRYTFAEIEVLIPHLLSQKYPDVMYRLGICCKPKREPLDLLQGTVGFR